MEAGGRIRTRNWERYDTRHVVYETRNMTEVELESGYWRAYREFYQWSNVFKASFSHDAIKHQLKHLFYTGGWKKFEGLWNIIINVGGLKYMLPLLECLLSEVKTDKAQRMDEIPGLAGKIELPEMYENCVFDLETEMRN
jgi:hypothetical protein